MDARAEIKVSIPTKAGRRLFFKRCAMIGAPVLILAAAAAGFQAMMASAPKPEQTKEEAAPPAVEIAVAQTERRPLTIETQAEVKAKTRASLAAQVSGQVVDVDPDFEPGASVVRGQVIARIDPVDYRLALDMARAERSRAGEALEKVQAEARLAEDEWRDLGLAESPSDLALFKPQVESAEAEVKAADARVAEAALDLSRTEVKAPFDGRIVERLVNIGDTVAAGAPLASIYSVDVMQARVPLSDSDLAVLGVAPGFIADSRRQALPARLTAAIAGRMHEWKGRLVSVDAAVDSQTRLTYGLVEIEDPFAATLSAPLTPGVFATVAISSAETESLTAIPRAAIKKGQTIYVVAGDDTIAARNVAPVMTTHETAYLSTGVKPGERVVVSYLASPHDGMKVRDRRAGSKQQVAASGDRP